MAYATLNGFRLLTHYKVGDISDADVTSLIVLADKFLIKLATCEVYMERLEGNIDGVNVDFRVKKRPIADRDSSGAVDKDDVDVYYATFDAVTNFVEFGSAQTVTSLQAKEGIITMTTAPTTTTAEAGVYAQYVYFPYVSDYDTLETAANYLLAYLVSKKVAGEVMTYREIAGARFKPTGIGADWLKLCFETINLYDNWTTFQRVRGYSVDDYIPVEVSKRSD